MARNKVQFQKGLSEAEFDELYGTEERCHAELARLRWPEGFECPDCGVQGHCVVKRGARLLFQFLREVLHQNGAARNPWRSPAHYFFPVTR